MILEGMVTSTDAAGRVNVAPMGPIVEDDFSRLVLRPFQSSLTFANLQQSRVGVFHVVDDVLLLARAAIGQLESMPPLQPAVVVDGSVLADACRWYEFRVTQLDCSGQRSRMTCEVVHAGRLRDFFGFNRARHAVIEAAILATRLHLLPAPQVEQQFHALQVLVEKTGSPREHEAFALLDSYRLQAAAASRDTSLRDAD